MAVPLLTPALGARRFETTVRDLAGNRELSIAGRREALDGLANDLPIPELSRAIWNLFSDYRPDVIPGRNCRAFRCADAGILAALKALTAKDPEGADRLATEIYGRSFVASPEDGGPWFAFPLVTIHSRERAATALRCLAYVTDPGVLPSFEKKYPFDRGSYEALAANLTSPYPTMVGCLTERGAAEVLQRFYLGAHIASEKYSAEFAPTTLLVTAIEAVSPEIAMAVACHSHRRLSRAGDFPVDVLRRARAGENHNNNPAFERDLLEAYHHFVILAAAVNRSANATNPQLSTPREFIHEHLWLVRNWRIFPLDLNVLPLPSIQKTAFVQLLRQRARADGPVTHNTQSIKILATQALEALDGVQLGEIRKRGPGYETKYFNMDLSSTEYYASEQGFLLRYHSLLWDAKKAEGQLVAREFHRVGPFVRASLRSGERRPQYTEVMAKVCSWAWHPHMDDAFPILSAVFSPRFSATALAEATSLEDPERLAIVVRGVRLLQETRRWDPDLHAELFNIDWLRDVLCNAIRGGSDALAIAAAAEVLSLLFTRQYQQNAPVTFIARLNSELNVDRPMHKASADSRLNGFRGVFNALLAISLDCCPRTEEIASQVAVRCHAALKEIPGLHPEIESKLRATLVEALSHVKTDGNLRSSLLGPPTT